MDRLPTSGSKDRSSLARACRYFIGSHETLSQFNLTVEYYPGKEILIADAMSRFAYPASSSREDVCFHGSAASHAEVTKLIQKENEQGRMVGMIRLGSTYASGSNTSGFRVQFHPGTIFISDPHPTQQLLFRTVNVIKRTGAGKADSVSDAPSSSGEEASVSSPPPAMRTRSRSQPIVPSAPMVIEMMPPQSSRSTRGRQQLRAQARDSSTLPPHQKSRVQPPSINIEASVPGPTTDQIPSTDPLGAESSVLLGQGSPESPPGVQFGQGSSPMSPEVLSGQGSQVVTPMVLSGHGSAAFSAPNLASGADNLASEAPAAAATTPEVTVEVPIEETNGSGAKPKARFKLPFDFPNPYAFRKPRTPVPPPASKPPTSSAPVSSTISKSDPPASLLAQPSGKILATPEDPPLIQTFQRISLNCWRV
jgi:hypothetical protein